jgi:hypothetical protein
VVVADLTERVEMLAEDAHPNDENRKLVAHMYAERDALLRFNESSQHRPVAQRVGDCSALRRGSSSRGSCEVVC